MEAHHDQKNPMSETANSSSAAYGSTESTPQTITADPSRWSSNDGGASGGDMVEDVLIKTSDLLRTSTNNARAKADLHSRRGGSTSFSFSVFNLMNAIMVSKRERPSLPPQQ